MEEGVLYSLDTSFLTLLILVHLFPHYEELHSDDKNLLRFSVTFKYFAS